MPSYLRDAPQQDDWFTRAFSGGGSEAGPYLGAGLATFGMVKGLMDQNKEKKAANRRKEEQRAAIQDQASGARQGVAMDAIQRQGAGVQDLISAHMYGGTPLSNLSNAVRIGSQRRQAAITNSAAEASREVTGSPRQVGPSPAEMGQAASGIASGLGSLLTSQNEQNQLKPMDFRRGDPTISSSTFINPMQAGTMGGSYENSNDPQALARARLSYLQSIMGPGGMA